jgi:hypothetical protein
VKEQTGSVQPPAAVLVARVAFAGEAHSFEVQVEGVERDTVSPSGSCFTTCAAIGSRMAGAERPLLAGSTPAVH